MNAIEIAKAKRTRLQSELRALDQFLAMAETLEQETDTQPNLFAHVMPTPPRSRQDSTKAIVSKASAEILAKVGAANTDEILRRLTEQGIDTAPNGGDKRLSLMVILSRNKEVFVNDKSAKVWRLVEKTEPHHGNGGVQ